MSVSTKDEFAQYCLRRLGAPAITINVTEEQVSDRIDEALQLFYERHYNAVEQTYILYDITNTDRGNQFIELDPDVVAVTDVLVPNQSAGMFNIEFQTQLENLYTTSSVTRMGDISYYYMMQSHLTLLNRFFNPGKQFTFNGKTHRLIIAGGVKNTDNIWGGVIIKAFKKVYPDADAADETNNVVSANIWSERWLQNYASSLIKLQWGQNLSKYQNVQLMGGVTLNGAEIKAEAKEEIEKLEQELRDSYEIPVGFIMG